MIYSMKLQNYFLPFYHFLLPPDFLWYYDKLIVSQKHDIDSNWANCDILGKVCGLKCELGKEEFLTHSLLICNNYLDIQN